MIEEIRTFPKSAFVGIAETKPLRDIVEQWSSALRDGPRRGRIRTTEVQKQTHHLGVSFEAN
jgi:hypothetical protein